MKKNKGVQIFRVNITECFPIFFLPDYEARFSMHITSKGHNFKCQGLLSMKNDKNISVYYHIYPKYWTP